MLESFIDLAIRLSPALASGALITVLITVLSMTAGTVIGLLVAVGRQSRYRGIQTLLVAYVELWRAVPLVVQLLFIYFTLPQFGVSLPAFWAGVLGLSLNLGAYLSEVFRSAISSVGRGQREAALAIGMRPVLVYRRIILPQALRVAVPTLGGYFISTLKDSSLVSFISVNDLLRQGTMAISSTFRTMEIYFLVALIYVVISFAASWLVKIVEARLTPQNRRGRRRVEPSRQPGIVNDGLVLEQQK